jgi:hypothetical protein
MKKVRQRVTTKKIPPPMRASADIAEWNRNMARAGMINRGRVRHKIVAKAAGFQTQTEEGGDEYIVLENGDELITEDAT